MVIERAALYGAERAERTSWRFVVRLLPVGRSDDGRQSLFTGQTGGQTHRVPADGPAANLRVSDIVCVREWETFNHNGQFTRPSDATQLEE